MGTINDRIAEIVEITGLSKTEFGEKISVTQQYISKLTKGGVPSDRTIADICRTFSISENWLRTGEGEMKLPTSRDEELTEFLAEIMTAEDADFRRQLVSVLARLKPEHWEALAEIAEMLAQKKE